MNQNALDYVVRSMIYIGSLPEGRYASGKEIAEAIGVSNTYLSKILQNLVRAGFLFSVTGPGRGFVLARPAAKIMLLDVMEAGGGPIKVRDECILGLTECSDQNPCPFHKDWTKHRRLMLKSFKNTTLADALDHAWPLYHSSGRPKKAGKSPSRRA